MRSATSFFDLTIYRKTVNRFWPLWTVNLVFWLFVLPLNGLVSLARYTDGSSTAIQRFACNVGNFGTVPSVVFSLFAGLLVAMAVCSHLYNNRSANFMAALPVRREGQFVSTYLAGLTMLIGPNILIFLLTLLVEVAGNAVMWVPLLFWLAALCAMEFFFYSFAVCLAQFAGHILAVPVYYGVFNVIVMAAYALVSAVLRTYYFGFPNDLIDINFVRWCTPVSALLEVDISVVKENGVYFTSVEGLWIIGVYAAIGLVLAVCALLLYRRRHMETAGDIVAVKAMRPVFKYGVAVCAGLSLGILTVLVLGLGEIPMMIAIVIWGVIGCFVAQMLLDKSIRVFRKWKGAVAVAAAFLLMFAVIAFDLTGYESHVPSAGEVKEVSISRVTAYPWDSSSSLNDVVLTDPDDIEKVIALHEAIVSFGENGEPQTGSEYTGYFCFNVCYTLKNGHILQRSYCTVAGNTIFALAQEIRDDYDVRYQSHSLDVVDEARARGGHLKYAAYYGDRIDTYYSEDGEFFAQPYDRYYETEWYSLDAERLWNAVMADFEAGRIGVKSVYSEEDRDTPNLDFVWYAPQSKGKQDADAEEFICVEFALIGSATETRKVLSELMVPKTDYQE